MSGLAPVARYEKKQSDGNTLMGVVADKGDERGAECNARGRVSLKTRKGHVIRGGAANALQR